MADKLDMSRLLGFPVELGLVLKHLKQDMRDDWYFDTLQYKDFFDSEDACRQVITESYEAGHGLYMADRPTVRGIPKKGYAERYALETDFFDRFIYQAAATFIIPYIDPMLSNRVLSYRFEKYPLDKKYLFKNKIERWNTFEGITYTFRKSGAHLAVTDLSNFFEGVSSEAICNKMLGFVEALSCTGEEKNYVRNAIECLRINLKKWSFQSGIGLPQNRDASSFLSNVMLHDVDEAMIAKGYDYYRYVDDIRIICPSESDARKSLRALTRELRTSGFSLNATKTKMLGPNSSSDEIEDTFTALDSDIAAINNMWKSRSRRVVIRSAKYISGIVSSKISEGNTQSRSFRFAVNRLSQLVQAGLIEFDGAHIQELREALLASLYDNAVSTDQYCRILIAIDSDGASCPQIEAYLLDANKSIYDWQNYNLWHFLARHKYFTSGLDKKAAIVLRSSADSGEAAAILVWAKAVDNKSLISEAVDLYLSKNGVSWPYLNQRYLMIAANGLDKEGLKRLAKPHHHKLNRTTSRCASLIPENGVPIIDPERPQLSFMIEEASDYA